MEFGTKAETLYYLQNCLKSAVVLPQIKITIFEWEYKRKSILDEIKAKGWYTKSLIIRSSSKNEDGITESQAGRFTSVLNVVGEANISKAVEKVISSYGTKDAENQILIQPMVQNVKVSGVAFSIDPNSCGNYIVINYDDYSGSTYSITSGNSKKSKTFYYFKNSKVTIPKQLNKIVCLIFELEKLFNTNKIDIEFAIDRNDIVYLFQVRSLVIHSPVADISRQYKVLNKIHEKISDSMNSKPYLYGKKTVYGVMPDWNPAEIIGIRPRQLSLSLYKELVTDNIWAYQRDNYGYRSLRSFPLLISFAGWPYIDVRVSFNSFLPKKLNSEISEKLINYYIDKLIDNPQYHDKVEFEIVFSCYTFDFNKRIEILRDYDFSDKEINAISVSLKELTNRIIDSDNGLLSNDMKKIKILEDKREKILSSSIDKVSKIYWLLEDCKRYGTLPFAGIARGEFIAIQILRSLVSVGILTNKDYQNYMGQLNTISSELNFDFQHKSKEDFLKKYGHIRPGTYDILSSRYDEEPEKYFDFNMKNMNKHESVTEFFKLSLEQLNKINKLLIKDGWNTNVLKLFDYIKLAIEGRELSKFIFTKSLSEALRLFGEVANENGISREKASYANINIIKEAYDSDRDIKELLIKSISEGKEKYNDTLQVTLPPLITSADDVWGFCLQEAQPNYITLKKSIGQIVNVENLNKNLNGNILIIPSADPGYDWIFSKQISGFITMYGGANSHMAIRANELSIPAVIGVGENAYNRYKKAKIVEIDCAKRGIRIVK